MGAKDSELQCFRAVAQAVGLQLLGLQARLPAKFEELFLDGRGGHVPGQRVSATLIPQGPRPHPTS